MMRAVRGRGRRDAGAYVGAIRALAAALDARDPYTAGHSERVSALSVAIGRQLASTEDDSRGPAARRAAARHRQDRRPRRGAAKAGRADRRRSSRRSSTHPGARRADPAQRAVPRAAHPDRRAASRAAGRPRLSHGLRGDEIPLARAHRPRRRRVRRDDERARVSPGAVAAEALRELWRCAGAEFDAEVVRALASALPSIDVAPTQSTTPVLRLASSYASGSCP